MFYSSFKNEVKTEEMIHDALKLEKRVVVPKVKGKNLILLEVKNPKKDLKRGSFKIREPFRGEKVSLKEVDLAVIPGVVFSKRGGRIGYGKGYFDRLLRREITRTKSANQREQKKCESTRKKKDSHPTLVGVAFDLQVVDEIPLKSFDVRVDKVITETRIYEKS